VFIRRLLPALAVSVLVLVLTRWPVACILCGLAVAFAPTVMGRTSATRRTDRIEAVAVWTELLRDTLTASAGLGEAIVATAPVAPAPVRDQVVRLANRLASGVPMTEGLRAFATEVDDPSCDMVACALLLAATSRAQKLTELLSALSESIRDEVAMRLRVEASRASARSSVRSVIVFSLLFVAALMVVARSYLEPFGTPLGQVILLAVGGCYAAGIALMVRLVRPPATQRLLGAVATEEGPS
jgi:tight adherence protein B